MYVLKYEHMCVLYFTTVLRSGINTTTGVGSNDQHPDHDISAGEQFYKDIYEAVRASPNWNESLLVITWDEHGVRDTTVLYYMSPR